MSRALIVVFHRYPGMVSSRYKLLFEYFKQEVRIWATEVDRIILVDSNHFLDPEDLHDFENKTRYPVELTLVKTENFSHAKNLAFAFECVKEDAVCFIDQDTLIYQAGTLDRHFTTLFAHAVVAFIERADATTISRFAPYFSIFRTEVLPKNPDFAEYPTEGHLDPLAKLSHTLLQNNLQVSEVVDDRSTIQMRQDGVILKNPSLPKETGIYHIRNFYGGLILLETYKHDRYSFHWRFDPMPKEEVTRLFGWLWLLNDKTRRDNQLYADIRQLLSDELGIVADWDHFMEEFRQYHSYI